VAKSPKAGGKERRLPSETELLEFIRSAPGVVAKRDIAKAFNLKGADKITLKQMLKDLADKGHLEKRGRRVQDSAALPAISVLEVSSDKDGDLIGTPVEWDDVAHGNPPRIHIIMPRAIGPAAAQQPPKKGDRVLAKMERTGDGSYRARVIRRLTDRGNRQLGVFRISKGHGMRVVPVDKKARHDFAIEAGGDKGAIDGELVEIEVTKDRGRGFLVARVRERLGSITDQRNISLIAIHQHGIPVKFPERVLTEVETLKAYSTQGREDLRHIPLLTIDPPDARDHDDAVYAEADTDPENAGGFKVIVAIADVAAYIRPQSALDREARIRGNSVYFPDRVVPMLPERISNDLCSLRELEDRPALACFITFDKSGTKRTHRFARILMRSAAKLSYQQAQAAIDGSPDAKAQPLLETALKPLWRAYAAVMKARNARGPLELDLPERKLILDAHGMIERVVSPERLDAHKLIEEFMIQANVAAAETLEQKRTPLIYRVHDEPSAEKLASLGDFLRTIGMSIPKGQRLIPRQFNRILDEAKGKECEHLVNTVVLRSQAQAVYSPENRGHFGLCLGKYAHFTSPIRRYADLIVHRALVSSLGFGDDGLSRQDMDEIFDTAELISGTERRAMAAERETVDRLIAAHLSTQIGATFRGRIGGVVSAGLFVTLDDSGADGFIPVSTVGNEYYAYDETRRALIGAKTGDTYQLGDKVEVRLKEATPVAGGLLFEMMSKGRKGKPAGPKLRQSSRRK
jgi:ribonuclease R